MNNQQLTLEKYQELAMRTAADPVIEGYGKLAKENLGLIMRALAIAGASADLCDMLKKGIFHKHGLEFEEVAEKTRRILDILTGKEVTFHLESIGEGDLTDRDGFLLCSILGLVGESGELANDFAFGVEDYSPSQKNAVIKEQGDGLWYQAAIAHAIGHSLGEVGLQNVDKLMRRYPEGFSSADSLERRDVVAEEPIKWNPGNKVVQSHWDGTIDHERTNEERAKRGLPIPWTESIGLVEQGLPDVP